MSISKEAIAAAYDAATIIVSQEDAEAGTDTSVMNWTAERIKQAIDALAAGSEPQFGYNDDGDVSGSVTVAYGSTNNYILVTATGNITSVTITWGTAGIPMFLAIEQGGSGSYTATGYAAAIKLPGGNDPVNSSGVGDIDILEFAYDGTNYSLVGFSTDLS